MRKFYFLIGIILINSMIYPVQSQEPKKKFTHWLTPDEKLHWSDVGKSFIETDPPLSPVRNVAEFDKMQGVLVAYPFGIPIALIKEMANDVTVTTIVANINEQNTVTQQYQAAGVNLSHCDFLIAPSDSYWTRDYGPWFESDSLNHIGIVDFPYNRTSRPNDDNIPVRVATMLGVPLYGMKLIHTGGNYMTDGMGISSSTDLVWTENPTQTQAQVAQKVHDYLGISNYMVVPDPNATYIDHIDCWGKFLAPDKILIRKVPPTHPRYSAIEATAAYYASQVCSYGYNYRVFRVNTPDDQPYTNSLILNNKVFVPVMNSTWDDSALVAYRAALPGYQVSGIPENPAAPWESTDALHCRTIGIADLGQLYIKHIPLSGNQPAQDNFLIQADLIRCSDSAAWNDSVLIWYKVDNGQFSVTHMTRTSGDHYQGLIPKQSAGSTIRYYLYAADKSGRHATAPFIGAADPFTFTVVYTDLTAIPDTLRFNTVEECILGKVTNIHNYTVTGINLNYLEESGYFANNGTDVRWFLDPVPVSSYPYLMNPGDSLSCMVRIFGPLDKLQEGFLSDTLHFTSAVGTHQIIILVSDSIWSRIKGNDKFAKQLMLSNYPNPFTGNTTITFSMNHQSMINLDILDLDGRKVNTLAEGLYPAGNNSVDWNGSDETGNIMPSGIYLYRITTEDKTITKRMVLIR